MPIFTDCHLRILAHAQVLSPWRVQQILPGQRRRAFEPCCRKRCSRKRVSLALEQTVLTRRSRQDPLTLKTVVGNTAATAGLQPLPPPSIRTHTHAMPFPTAVIMMASPLATIKVHFTSSLLTPWVSFNFQFFSFTDGHLRKKHGGASADSVDCCRLYVRMNAYT